MAATVGSVIINLRAQTAQFDAGMAKGTSRLKRFSAGAANLAKTFGKLAIAAAAIGTLALVKQNLGAIDSAAKLARQIDITTEKLVGLRFAAEQTGNSTKSLDAGLATLAKRLGEGARRGTGPAVEALQELGLNIKEIAALPLDQAFARIADGMNKLEGTSRRNAVAANLFSKANQGLLLTLDLGSDGLAKFQKEAEFLGFTFSQLEANEVEKANDAFNAFTKSVGGLAIQLTLVLAPALTAIGKGLTSITIKANTAIATYKQLGREISKALIGDQSQEKALRAAANRIELAARNARAAARAAAAGPVEGFGVGPRDEAPFTRDAQRTFAIMREASDRILRFGKSADELAIAELRSLRGVGEADITFLRRQQERFAELEATAKAREDAARAEERRQDAFANFFRTAAPAALERGTAAAFSASNRARIQSGERGIPGLLRKADEQLRIQREMNQHLMNIEDNLDVLEEAPF